MSQVAKASIRDLLHTLESTSVEHSKGIQTSLLKNRNSFKNR